MDGLEDMAREIAADVYGKLAGQPAGAGALEAKVAAAKGGQVMFGHRMGRRRGRPAMPVEGKDAAAFPIRRPGLPSPLPVARRPAGKVLVDQDPRAPRQRSAAIAKALARPSSCGPRPRRPRPRPTRHVGPQAAAEGGGIILQAREEVARMRTKAPRPAWRPPSRCASSRRSTASPSRRPLPPSRCATPPSTLALGATQRAPARAGRVAASRRPWSTRRSPSCRSRLH